MYLIIDEISSFDNDLKPFPKLLYYLIFCDFFKIIEVNIVCDIGKLSYSLLNLYQVIVRLIFLKEIP
jgi:hypothetical protein